MTALNLISRLHAWATHLACQWRESRRLRRDLAVLAAMNAHELRDIGISHAAVIANAAGARHGCCA